MNANCFLRNRLRPIAQNVRQRGDFVVSPQRHGATEKDMAPDFSFSVALCPCVSVVSFVRCPLAGASGLVRDRGD